MNGTQTGFFGMAAGVLWWQVALAALGGIVAGAGSGWLAVVIERFEKLEAEENDERREYETEVATKRKEAEENGEDTPEAAPWEAERYGWTWLERWLSPALMAALFAAFVYHLGWSGPAAARLLWVAVFVHIIGFDIKHRLILNVITYPSVVAGLALAVVTPGLGIVPALVGAVVCWLFFAIQNFVTRGGIGLGDAKLGAVIGAVLGLDFPHLQFGALYALIYGVFLGGAVAILLLITRVRRLKDPIPYGPFLCAGALLILYQGFG